MEVDKEIDILIVKHFSRSITSEEKNVLKAWVLENQDNKGYFDQLKNIWEVSHPLFNPEDIDLIAAEAKVMGKINKIKWTQAPIIIWWQRIAAVLIIPFLLLYVFYPFDNKKDVAETVYQEVFSPYGVHTKLNLPDGSIVWLNSGSRLKYSIPFQKGERKVFLLGEALFEVHSDKANPFIVKTSKLSIRATGTKFNVEAYTTDTVAAVTLIHGKVGVTILNQESIELQPDHRLYYNNATDKVEITKVDTYKFSSWTDGVLAFRDDRLDYIFKKIGLTYNVDITILDKELASQLYRATFEGETLEEILRLMKMSSPLRYKRFDREKAEDGQFKKEKIEVYRAQ